jgi:hypothetical protein
MTFGFRSGLIHRRTTNFSTQFAVGRSVGDPPTEKFALSTHFVDVVPMNKLHDPIILSVPPPMALATIYFVLIWKPRQSNS